MSGWTKQMGFPVVSVSQTVNGRERQLHLKQNRFIADGGQDSNNQIWQAINSIFLYCEWLDLPSKNSNWFQGKDFLIVSFTCMKRNFSGTDQHFYQL